MLTESMHTNSWLHLKIIAEYTIAYPLITWENPRVPYSGKVWRGESLANLVNRRRFAKLKPTKLIPVQTF